MAFLADGRMRALDNSGNPLSGAKLYVYQVNTTTPLSIYTDAALSTPSSNPVTADSYGWFPQVFAAEATQCDVVLKDSSGNTIKSYEDVTFVGADSADLTRTLTDLTRFKVRGSGGVVYLDAGNPSPTNTGGTLVIEGWAGSSADSITLKATSTSVTGTLAVTGRLTEGGKKLQGTVQTEVTTFSAVSSVDITLTNSPSGVRAWQVDIIDLVTSSSGTVSLQVSYDSSTFKSGATDYAYSVTSLTAATAAGASANTATAINVISNPNLIAGQGGTGGGVPSGRITLDIVGPNSGTGATLVRGEAQGGGVGGSNPLTFWRCVGAGLGDYGRPTTIRLAISAGTFTGKYRVVSLRGTGD